MEEKSLYKPRPSWHVDLKWIFGILFSITLLATTILFVFSRLTAENTAIPLGTYLVANQFSPNGLDDPEDIERIKQEFLLSGKEKFYPFEDNRDVFVTKEEANTLSPREIRLKIFRQLIEPIYYGNTTKESLGEHGVLAVINQNTHNLLSRFFAISIFPFLIFLAGLVYFSHGYGRLISPAIPLLGAGSAPSLFLFLATHINHPAGDIGPLSALPKELLNQTVSSIAIIFYIYFFAGLVLIIIALILKLTIKNKKQGDNPPLAIPGQ